MKERRHSELDRAINAALQIDRRGALGLLAASPLLLSPFAARASEAREITWDDLIPEEHRGVLFERLRELGGLVDHTQPRTDTGFIQPEARAVTNEFNGQNIKLPGYVVPLDFEATGLDIFILAPFIGACIHVPPPPPNQLVLVTTDEPYVYKDLYDPIWASGIFAAVATGTGLAEIGYSMAALEIEPYYS